MLRILPLAAVALVVVLPAGCGSHRNVVEKVRDNVYRLTCHKALPVCLAEEAEARCQGYHYVVLRAVNEINLRGVVPNQMEDRSSEAVIQCGLQHDWGAIGNPMEGGGADKALVVGAAGDAVAAHPASAACVPGATQACVGAAGCHGGQACRPDGGGYLSCDCGAPSAPDPTQPAN
ncbi:MAG: hypothetical protein JWM82_3689 [Myxococcales bacterium]|nr:hypothetical protein [Myxococcales bacterium]